MEPIGHRGFFSQRAINTELICFFDDLVFKQNAEQTTELTVILNAMVVIVTKWRVSDRQVIDIFNQTKNVSCHHFMFKIKIPASEKTVFMWQMGASLLWLLFSRLQVILLCKQFQDYFTYTVEFIWLPWFGWSKTDIYVCIWWPPLIGWTHTQNDPCFCILNVSTKKDRDLTLDLEETFPMSPLDTNLVFKPIENIMVNYHSTICAVFWLNYSVHSFLITIW